MAAICRFSERNERHRSTSVNEKSSKTTWQSAKNLDPNVELAFGWNRMILRIFGLWPDQICKDNQIGSIIRYIAPIWVVWLLTFLTVPQVLASFMFTSVLDEIIELIVDAAGIIGAVARIVVFWYNSEVLAWCISIATEDWTRKHTVKEQELMIKNAKLGRGISICVTTLSTSVLVSYFFMKSITLRHLNFDTQNVTDIGKELLAPSYFPFNLNKRSNFAFAWSGQCFAFIVASTTHASADSFVASLIIHLCGQIAILRHSVAKLIDNNMSASSGNFRKKLAIVVKRHNTITQLATAINDAVDLMLLVVMLVYTIELGLQVYRLLLAVTERKPGQFPFGKVIFCISFLIVMLVHLLGYCYVGDMLIQESEALELAIYSCNWYNLSDKTAKDIILVMHRARSPLQIWAGKFVPFSLELFANVLKTSMGYFSLLLTITERST